MANKVQLPVHGGSMDGQLAWITVDDFGRPQEDLYNFIGETGQREHYVFSPRVMKHKAGGDPEYEDPKYIFRA